MSKLLIVEQGGCKIAVAENVIIAKTFFDRLFGLTVRKFNDNFDGIAFFNCNSIHSCFMLYKFDLIFVDKSKKVVKLYRGVKPFRICLGTKDSDLMAIELPKGTIDKYNIVVDCILEVEK